MTCPADHAEMLPVDFIRDLIVGIEIEMMPLKRIPWTRQVAAIFAACGKSCELPGLAWLAIPPT